MERGVAFVTGASRGIGRATSLALAATLRGFGRIDPLVNNAIDQGPGRMDRFLDVPVDVVETILIASVVAPAYLTQKVLPGMIDRRGGTIVNLTSGSLAGWNGLPAIR